ncbi:hypothetical protein ET495_05490 [Xylanimonas allomyrinae]|uniref:Uncharacterized protein n=1 Tax=Xylanimonas allomyrinae TaxID=2509459 RepID=A0A4P6ENB8_9MICO|nr:hypothetical protein [Xylanimonas allomyrinae]QAY62799.1 hypothetical protein ET495_05490 [Xylanimonas allomyrinae]
MNGVVQYTPKSPDSRWDGADPRTGQWTLDEATAQASGYPFLRERPPAAEGIPADVVVTDALQKTMASCAAKANERVGKAPERLLNDIETAGWNALDGAPEAKKAIADWRTCMAPVGLVDLPADPSDMPPTSVVARPGQADNPGVPLTNQERTVAVADARCRAQVDYYGTELRLRAQGELTAIGANLKEFEAARAGYQEH